MSIELTKQEARMMARIMGNHGVHLRLFGRMFSVTVERTHFRYRPDRLWWY